MSVVMVMLVIMCMHVLFVSMLMVVIMFVRMLMIMFMYVLVFFDTVNNYMRMCAFDTALDALFETICDTGNANGIELIFTCFYAARKLGQ